MHPAARRLATAAVGTSIGVCVAVQCRRSSLERDGYPPVTHPHCPEYLKGDADLQLSRLAKPSDTQLTGHWLAWYNGPLVVRLETTADSAVTATHLTGSLAVPAGCSAFTVSYDEVEQQMLGKHFGSLLPFGLWLSSAPCRLNTYRADLSQQVLDNSTLSVDIFIIDWLPPVRVPMQRIPDGVYLEMDEAGHVPRGSQALVAAQAAVASARFDDRAKSGA